jgi:hypothetical protein
VVLGLAVLIRKKEEMATHIFFGTALESFMSVTGSALGLFHLTVGGQLLTAFFYFMLMMVDIITVKRLEK